MITLLVRILLALFFTNQGRAELLHYQ